MTNKHEKNTERLHYYGPRTYVEELRAQAKERNTTVSKHLLSLVVGEPNLRDETLEEVLHASTRKVVEARATRKLKPLVEDGVQLNLFAKPSQVAAIDKQAERFGLTRNEFVRYQIEQRDPREHDIRHSELRRLERAEHLRAQQ